MRDPLLRTKLFIPPLRPNLVPRLRLVARLNQGLAQGHRLSLISAPAGFGKTTLLSRWIGSAARKTAWLSLDESDNDPQRFAAYMVAAMGTVLPGAGAAALTALTTPQPLSAEVALAGLINDIAAGSDEVALVLDDYHAIDAVAVHAALSFLIEHQPPQLHLIVATREDPDLPLGRLRAGEQLTELRATDLRFTADETTEFLRRVMGLDVTDEQIAALEERTEGWIAGLQLAALSLRGDRDTADQIASFSGSHRYVLDYLIEEVLEQQTPQTERFLLQTAVLERMTGSLCNALTGRRDGQSTLRDLEAANLFIVPLDQERRWYRYHHLFADLLRQRLRQQHPDWPSALNERASAWFAKHAYRDEAVEHALRAGQYERAADLIAAHFGGIWQFAEHGRLRRWLDSLPTALTLKRPSLCLLHAALLYTRGEIDRAEELLERCEAALADETVVAALPAAELRRLRGRAAALRSYLLSYHGDGPASIQQARLALRNLPSHDAAWRWSAHDSIGTIYSGTNDPAAYQARAAALAAAQQAGNAYLILLASMRLVVTLRDMGRLAQALEVCRQQWDQTRTNGLSETALAGWLCSLWSEALAETDELDEALHRAECGTALTTRSDDVTLRGSSLLCLIRVLFSRGDFEAAERVIREGSTLPDSAALSPWITVQMAAWQARIHLAQGRLEAAAAWANELAFDPAAELTALHDFDYGVLARLLLAQGRADEALALLEQLRAVAEAGGRTAKTLELTILLALAWQAAGDERAALQALEAALALAEPGGFVRAFLDEGPELLQLLRVAQSRGIAPASIQRLLARAPATAVPPPASLDVWLEPLSERELEVLQLIAAGLNNPQIAEQLFLTLNTVKTHTRNIYGKLDVHSRTQAVARARALGLLSDR